MTFIKLKDNYYINISNALRIWFDPPHTDADGDAVKNLAKIQMPYHTDDDFYEVYGDNADLLLKWILSQQPYAPVSG